LIVKFAIAGNELTVVGLTLQLPTPYVAGQLRVTVPEKPSCDVIEMTPVVPVLPTFTLGNRSGPFKLKSAFEMTLTANGLLSVDGAPTVLARRMTV
jgi:hypothetical protein